MNYIELITKALLRPIRSRKHLVDSSTLRAMQSKNGLTEIIEMMMELRCEYCWL
jgi:hypothetical protein